jgi:hypothetical protein
MKTEIFDFSTIIPECIYDIIESKRILNTLIHNKKLTPCINRKSVIQNKQLIPFFKSLYYHTSFLNPSTSIKERCYCLYNDVIKYPNCLVCNKHVTTFQKNFSTGYYGKFCNHKCNRAYNNPHDYMSTETDKKMRNKLSVARKLLFKNGMPEKWKKKLSDSASKEVVKNKKKKTNLDRYGVENAGILGAYYSKSATIYINKFIELNGIDKNLCFYYDKDLGKKEFFQMLYTPILDKQKYYSYDLVVFKDLDSFTKKDLNGIELVLEYNGPWHYLKKDVINHENEKAVPYTKNNTYKYTKKEVYEMDKIKIEHILKYSKKALIYFEKHDKLIEIKQGESYDS